MSRLQRASEGLWARNKGAGAERRVGVRTACDLLSALERLAAVGVVLAVGCTEGGPRPAPEQHGDLPEPAQVDQAHAGFVFQPDSARVIDPATQPRLELALRDPWPEYHEEPTDVCAFVVEPRAFPAISEDGATLVHASIYDGGNAGNLAERMQLIWLDADQTRHDPIYNRNNDQPWDPNWSGCEGSIAAVRERVEAVNMALAERTWRPLERLDAFYSEPGFVVAFGSITGNEDAAIAGLAGGDRPIEVYYRNETFIARVRGIEVLQKTPRPDWRRPADEMCDSEPQIAGLDFDRASAVALVRYNYSTGGCMCDDSEHVGRLELAPALLEAIDQRSMAPFWAARASLLP